MTDGARVTEVQEAVRDWIYTSTGQSGYLGQDGAVHRSTAVAEPFPAIGHMPDGQNRPTPREAWRVEVRLYFPDVEHRQDEYVHRFLYELDNHRHGSVALSDGKHFALRWPDMDEIQDLERRDDVAQDMPFVCDLVAFVS